MIFTLIYLSSIYSASSVAFLYISYGDILLPHKCEINYINMQLNSVNMRHIHDDIQYLYVEMQHNYVNMRDNFVNIACQHNYVACCKIFLAYRGQKIGYSND